MKFETLYKLVKLLKRVVSLAWSVFSGIWGFLFSVGLSGIVGLFIMFLIIRAIFEHIWLETILVIIVGILIISIYLKIRAKYVKKKEEFFKSDIEKIVNEVFEKNKDKFVPFELTLKYLADRKKFYVDGDEKEIPLSEQENYYQEGYNRALKLQERTKGHYQKYLWLNKVNTYIYDLVQYKIPKAISSEKIQEIADVFSNFEHVVNDTVRDLEGKLRIVQAGQEGERRMAYALNLLKNQEDLIFLENILLEHNSKTFETDFLVLSNRGIFSLEVKNIGVNGNFSIRITEDGQWLKVFKDGDISPMKDISSQLNYHTSLTEGLLKAFTKETGIELPKVTPLIIIANNEVLIDNCANLPISRISKFDSDLKSKPAVYDMKDMRKLYAWLESKRLPEKAYQVVDHSQGLINIFEQLEKVNDYVTQVDILNLEIKDALMSKNSEYINYIERNC